MSAVEPVPPKDAHRTDVAAAEARVRRIIGVLRELDLGEAPPAASPAAGWDGTVGGEESDASL
ncbi:MAG TPA: hypothetical protein VFY14_15630 [Streptomyces sp.]|nr:hypothetical protein [Streptomyces sp.]